MSQAKTGGVGRLRPAQLGSEVVGRDPRIPPKHLIGGLRWPSRGALNVILLVGLLGSVGLHAAEVIPPRPTAYFNDFAGLVSPSDASQLNQQLQQFERDTSNQILVAVFPRMQSDSSVEDYTVRVAQAWGAGQKDKRNGAVLFAFMQEHQLRIQVGYGLEAVLPDGLCRLIIENELKPRFRSGDYAGGLSAAVNAMIAATRGEYRGSGRTNAEVRSDGSGWPTVLGFFLVAVLVFFFNRSRQRSAVYRGGRGPWSGPTMWLGGGGLGGGGFSGGGGGGGFSGGGGSFGGGGAGGSW
jgi:uncharacterized protein